MSTSNPRPYQGYPYVNPPVHEAPTIDAATAARWTNLPRKQVEPPVKQAYNVVFTCKADAANKRQDAETRTNSQTGQDTIPQKPDTDTSPVVYIDMPEASGSHVAAGIRESSVSDEEPDPSTYRPDTKRDPADEPVVYIDMPEGNGSNVTDTHVEDEPEYVQETIFFDPFENRRIEMNKESSNPGRDSDSEDDVSIVSDNSRQYQQTPVRRPLPPIRPNTLDLYGAGSSGVTNLSPAPVGLPSLMSKEAMLYQGTGEAFPMTGVSEFREPPPAYAEIDSVRSPVADPSVSEPVVEQPRREELPRTQVILPRDHIAPTTPIGVPNPDRKYLNCHHCGMRVHTLVVKENGSITHAIALMCLIVCCMPVIACIYCTDYFKITNHYCPNCNKVIGYELPFTKRKIVYVN